MTSAGSEDAVNDAKRTLTSGVIGLVVVLVSYSVIKFIVNVVT